MTDAEKAAGTSVESGAAIERELRRLLRRARAYSVELARLAHPGLDPAVHALLVDIFERGTVRAADLADERGVTKGVISRQVRSLEHLGLLARQPDESDARAHTLVLTVAGRRAVRRSQAARQRALEALLQGCTEAELAEMARSFERFNDLLE